MRYSRWNVLLTWSPGPIKCWNNKHSVNIISDRNGGDVQTVARGNCRSNLEAKVRLISAFPAVAGSSAANLRYYCYYYYVFCIRWFFHRPSRPNGFQPKRARPIGPVLGTDVKTGVFRKQKQKNNLIDR